MKAFIITLITLVVGLIALTALLPAIIPFIGLASTYNSNPAFGMIVQGFVLLLVVLFLANLYKVWENNNQPPIEEMPY